MSDFLLPDLGEGLEDAEVLAWRVRVGDRVSVDQVVVEVETAKAVVDVPIPFAGTVTTLHAEPGHTVRVGRPLISVAPAVESSPPARLSEPAVEVAPAAEESSGNVLIGYGTIAPPARRRRARPGRPAPVTETFSPATAAAPGSPTAIAVVSPIVRKLARDASLDLAAVRGTGPGGVIRRADVEEALLVPAALPAPVVEQRGVAPDEEPTRIPLRGVRRTIADKLNRSRREIPEATVWVDVDATELLAVRAATNAGHPDRPIGLLAFLARFTLLALARYPELNARVEAEEIVVPHHVNLGFAAQTDRGLVVPVIRQAQRMSTRELSAALAEKTAAARAGRLSPAELTGGTITLNNYGVFGVDGSAAIINHPEVAIVGVGRIIDRPWVVDGELAVRKICQLTLAFDHRACDGGTAGGFLRYLADCIEAPLNALAEL